MPFTIRDPVHGSIHLDELEGALLLSWPLQRLRSIRQLGLVDTVYPGACHSRFEHSLGCMHMAGLMAEHLGLSTEDVRQARLGGLLHDLGHSALSHAVEEVLTRNPDIQPIIAGKRIHRHEELTRAIISEHPFGVEALRLAERDFGDCPAFFLEIAEIAAGLKPPLGQIIKGDIDADRIDFLLRDSHHCGVSLGLVDRDQILEALTIKNGQIVLAGEGDYPEEMSRTAAESMLIARAHHYNAIIHHPEVQSARGMLLVALERALSRMEPEEAKRHAILFFREYTDYDLLEFIRRNGDETARRLLERVRKGMMLPLAARFDHKSLSPEIRLALSTISRNGRMKKLFEDSLGRKYDSLVCLAVGGGVPGSTRTESGGFLYDESALASGLVRSLARQIAISFFSDERPQVMRSEIMAQADRILAFIRSESSLPIDGLLLLFYSLHQMLSERLAERILIPRIRNITWLYRTVARIRDQGPTELSGLFDYDFHERYGFPYSERLFEDIQILVASGIVYQDMRHYERDEQWLLRYEYMLTSEGIGYAERISSSYEREATALQNHLRKEKHSIPYDVISLNLKRYSGKSA